MSVQRVLRGSSATIVETITDGFGAVPASPPTTATVSVVAADGTDLGDPTANPTGNPSEFSVTIDSAMTANLDVLTLTWQSAGFSTTTFVDVVGGFLFNISDLRSVAAPLANTTTYPTVVLANVRASVEDAIESQLGYALVPRFGTKRFGVPLATVRLAPYLRSVRTISDYGTAVDVADVTYDYTGYVSGYNFLSPSVFGFEHGLDAPSPQATAAALLLAKTWAIKGPIDDRTTSFTSDVGITSQLLTPGIGGSIFGLPAVDQWIATERLIGAA